MSSTTIKKVTEKKVETSKDEFENQVEITFERLKNDIKESGTITLQGEGSLKVLVSV